MTKQNSFRIRNYENELATIFPIGMGEFYTVAWDNDAPDTTIYTKQQVDSAFEKGKWEKIEADASDESHSFRYYHKDSPETIGRFFRKSDSEGIVYYEDDTDPCTHWGPKEAENFINIGWWIVVGEDFVAPSEQTWNDGVKYHTSEKITIGDITFEVHGKDSEAFKDAEKKYIDTLQLKIEIDGVKEAYEMLEEMVTKSNTLLQTIKSFTSGSGHDVFISEGVYKVYRSGEDVPYVCNTDQDLIACMDALTVLDGLETEF